MTYITEYTYKRRCVFFPLKAMSCKIIAKISLILNDEAQTITGGLNGTEKNFHLGKSPFCRATPEYMKGELCPFT